MSCQEDWALEFVDLGITPNDRKWLFLVVRKKKKQGASFGTWIRHKRRDGDRKFWLLCPTAALLDRAIKKLAHIDKYKTKLIEPEYVQPIQGLKINHLGSRNPRLHRTKSHYWPAMTNEDAVAKCKN